MIELNELAKKYGSPKRIRKLPFLCLSYDFHFKDKRNNINSIFEIGVDEGASFQIWEEYFPNAKIYGLDWKIKKLKYKSSRCKIFEGNQTDLKVLKTIIDEIGQIDVIVDDGSHYPADQIKSFDFLFNKMLKPGGIYIIEDIHSSYKDKKPGTFIPRIVDLIDSMHFPFWKSTDKQMLRFILPVSVFDRWVKSVHIHPSVVYVYKHNTDAKPLWKASTMG